MSNKVTLYIAAGSDLQSVRNLAKREQVLSSNVQDKWVRQEVTAAWRSVLRYLEGIRRTPPNGLVLFADSSGVEAIEPPVPNRSNVYRCGSDFYRGPLDALHDEAAGPKTGLVLIDTNEATVAWFRGDTVVPLWHDYSGIQGKHRMGGMSSARFMRGHEEKRKQWWRKVADIANQSFIGADIDKVLIGGPGHLKNDLLNDRVLDYRLQVIGTVDHGYVDDVYGPRECLQTWRAKPLNTV